MVNVAFVASEFNAPLPDEMVGIARAKAEALGARIVTVVRVPGAWEIPLAVHSLISRRDVDAVVVLGAIVRGETKHDELIASAVAEALQDLQLSSGKPIGLGITGPGMTWRQAEERVENAARAVDAAIRMVARPTKSRKTSRG